MNDFTSLRRRIDSVDGAIRCLVLVRARFSHEIQLRKTAAGVPVVDPEREARIIARYERGLKHGGSLGRAVLEACRL